MLFLLLFCVPSLRWSIAAVALFVRVACLFVVCCLSSLLCVLWLLVGSLVVCLGLFVHLHIYICAFCLCVCVWASVCVACCLRCRRRFVFVSSRACVFVPFAFVCRV